MREVPSQASFAGLAGLADLAWLAGQNHEAAADVEAGWMVGAEVGAVTGGALTEAAGQMAVCAAGKQACGMWCRLRVAGRGVEKCERSDVCNIG